VKLGVETHPQQTEWVLLPSQTEKEEKGLMAVEVDGIMKIGNRFTRGRVRS